MRQVRISRRRAMRPTGSETEPLTEDLRTSSRRASDTAVVVLAHIDELICETS
jgi:hypothetical protein